MVTTINKASGLYNYLNNNKLYGCKDKGSKDDELVTPEKVRENITKVNIKQIAYVYKMIQRAVDTLYTERDLHDTIEKVKNNRRGKSITFTSGNVISKKLIQNNEETQNKARDLIEKTQRLLPEEFRTAKSQTFPTRLMVPSFFKDFHETNPISSQHH